MKMFVSIEQFRGEVPFTHWVSRIAVTTCIDSLRAQKRRPELRWADLSENEADVLDAVLCNESYKAPDDALASRELIEKLLSELKPEDQLVIRLVDLEQKSIADVSRITGWKSPLVKVRAFRARRKLRKIFIALSRKERT